MVKVSVVIPVYNVEDFLGECLDSICNQTLTDIEIICVNDGSKDKSPEILKDYAEGDSRITVINQENGGHAVATNNGMAQATGKYLFLMDSDDILDLKALEKTYELAEKKDVDFVLFQAINYYMDTGELVEQENYSMNALARAVGNGVFDYTDIKDYLFDITVTPWSKLYNREFIQKNGITFPEGLIFDDNVFFWKVLFSAKRITFLKEHLFKRRWYSTSSTTAGDRRFIDTIMINNLITKTFIDYGVFEEYKCILYNRKIRSVLTRYINIKDEYKEEFYLKLKEDFTKMLSHEKYEDFLENVTQYNRKRFDLVVNSNGFEDFDLHYENLYLKHEVERLEKLNEELMNSKSWKLTRPLREFKKKI